MRSGPIMLDLVVEFVYVVVDAQTLKRLKLLQSLVFSSCFASVKTAYAGFQRLDYPLHGGEAIAPRKTNLLLKFLYQIEIVRNCNMSLSGYGKIAKEHL